MRLAARLLPSVLICLVVALPALAQAPVTYRVSFPAPEHHYAQIEVTFPNVPAGTLEARMSRSSPGRYAVHEYAKNVFELQAFDGKGKMLVPTGRTHINGTWPGTTARSASSTRSMATMSTGPTSGSIRRTRT